LLVLPLLSSGANVSVASRMKYLQERRDQLDRRQLRELYYLLGRLLESRRRLEDAAAAYKTVVAEDPEHRDASSRLAEVRRRLEVETSEREARSSEEDLDASGLTRYLAAHPHATQRVVLKPSHAATGSVSQNELTARMQELEQDSRGTESGGHFLISGADLIFEERVSPWWEGADFLRVRDPESGETKLAVSFPLAQIGERADSFEHILRQLQTLKQRAILVLQQRLLASDKVLLVYEDFDGIPLADELAAVDHRREFAPRSALHLLLQLCEALDSAHKLGLTHQWLSPRTVLINHQNRCKLVGLGLREFLAASDSTSRAYISPEVAENAPAIGPASDVYSMGLLAMQLLDVQLPVDWGEKIDPDRFGWPRIVAEEIPTSLRSTLVRCLDRDPLARPSTSDLASALTSVGLATGQLLAGRYEVIQEIGRGGMSRVYKAEDQELGGEVA
ncbi:MAG: protein kinase, partial [Holophagales bacterium]|nr:protein kinase [Holophagales bacterium]